MTLEDFIKEHPCVPPIGTSMFFQWLRDIWQASHSEGEKVGWENGMREAITYFDIGSEIGVEQLVLRAIDARKDKHATP